MKRALIQKKKPKSQNELTFSSKKSMKVKLTILLLFAIAFLFLTESAFAGTVRGRLDRQGPYGIYPFSYVPVTLYSPIIRRTPPAYTGSDGMYYLYNIPPGDYTLEIWVQGFRYQPITYRIRVFNQRYTDIKPILMP